MLMSSSRLPRCQRPWPLTRPAGPLAPASWVSKCSIASWSGWRGVAWPVRLKCAIGRRCASQAPGRRLASVMRAMAGWSSPLDCTCAWPLSAVCGQPGCSADRSSSWVARFSAPSGQRSKGNRLARAVRVGGRAVPPGRPASCRLASSRASGPRSCSCAAQGAGPSRWAASRAVKASGAALSICADPARPVPCQARLRSSTRCRAPWASPRPRCAVSPVIAGWSSINSWRISSLSTWIVKGRRRSAGACSVLSCSVPLRQTTRSAVTRGRRSVTQALG